MKICNDPRQTKYGLVAALVGGLISITTGGLHYSGEGQVMGIGYDLIGGLIIGVFIAIGVLALSKVRKHKVE